MPNTNDNVIVVKRQNFDIAMKSIKDLSNQAKEHEPLDRVSNSGGFLGLGDHKVTGYELNNMVSQVEGQLVDMKNFYLGFLDIITSIYKALDALDREHISGILIAANAAKVASDKATQNVEAIQKIVKVLQKFNKKLENLEHLMDVDKAWELLEEQTQLLKDFSEYKDKLSKLEHLKDVDKLWDDKVSQSESLDDLAKKLGEIDRILEAQGESISDFTNIVKNIFENQQSFIDSTNKRFAEHQATVESRLVNREKAIEESFTSLSELFNRNQDDLNRKVDELSKVQADKLDSLDKAQTDRLNQIEVSQTQALGQIAKAQSATLSSIEKAQVDRLNQISIAQVEKLEAINKSLEEEKSTLNEMVTTLARKIKIAYILAGGAASISIIHLLFNIIGIL